MTKKVLKQAIEAMKIAQDNLRPHGDNCFLHDEGEYNRCFCGKDSLSDHLQSVVEYLEEALKQEQDEPIVLVTKIKIGGIIEGMLRKGIDAESLIGAKLYTKPPKRKPLTDEEIRKFQHHMVSGAYQYSFIQGVRYAESAHGIKE